MKRNVHIKKGDNVVVIAGKDLGKKGKVLEVMPDKNKVVVEKVNIVKRHTRATREIPQGGIVEKENAFDSSNVMLVCPKCQQPTRVGKKILDNEKYRFCKKCEEIIDK